MLPSHSVSVQGGAGFEQIVNKIKGPALEMLAGAARPGKPMLQDGPMHPRASSRWPQNSFLARSVPSFSGSTIVFKGTRQKVGPAGLDSGPGILGDLLDMAPRGGWKLCSQRVC